MAEHNEKFKISVYNTITRKEEEVEVSEEIYTTYRRTGWNIQDNNQSFYSHEIQWSGLIGGDDENYENFKEFIDLEHSPEDLTLQSMKLNELYKAISQLNSSEQELIQAVYFKGLTERELAKIHSVSCVAVHTRKQRVLQKLKKFLI